MLFGILDFFELVFDILGITAPVGVFFSVLSTIFYMIILLFKYGPKKTKERLFTFKKVPRLKAFKKVMKVFGASIIPFMTTWAVWDDYQEDLEEAKKKKLDIEKQNIEAKNKININNKKEEINNTNILANKNINNINSNRVEEYKENDKEDNGKTFDIKSDTENTIKNPWMTPIKKEIKNKNEQKTISEEVGGMNTGLSREDYDENITDYSKPKTYEDLIEAKKKEKEEKDKRAQKEAKQKKIQGIKAEQDLRQELFDRSKRRYGDRAKETKRLEDKYRENLDDENMKMAA